MKRKKFIIISIMMILLIILFAGCKNDSDSAKVGGMTNTDVTDTRENEVKNILVEGDCYPYTITDYLNNKITLDEMPKNFAVTSGTFLNMWYALGGQSICTTELKSSYLDPQYCDEMMQLPSIGQVYNPNTEAIVELQPEFTVAQVGTQSSMVNTLKKMGMDAIALHMRSYEDVLVHLRAFGKILEVEEKAEEIISQMEIDKKAIIDNLPDDDLSIVILYVTSSSLSVKLDNSIAGDVSDILELDNIASDLPPDTIGSETAPLDIEYIVEKDPDFVLVTSMISSNEDAKRVMEEEFSTNPAWLSVEAVQENRVIYLPQQYFLYNAGHRYVDAIEYMAKGIYPQIYGGLDE